MRAMIVDDSKPIRMIEREILTEMGFDTFDAINGRDALEKLERESPPDVILLDWNMPEMDGLQFVKAMRKDPRYREIVVLMVTTETEPEQMLRALSAGADEYLMKPFTKENLISKLQLIGAV